MFTYKSFLVLVWTTLIGLLSQCTPLGSQKSTDGNDSNVLGSVRALLYPVKNIDNIKFEVNVNKKAFDVQNNFWMSYFAALEYSHFSLVAQQLDNLGFGEKDEARLYLKRWYDLRLAKVKAGVKDIDDTWTSVDQQGERLKTILSEYRRDFPTDADLNPKSVEEAEREIIGVHDDGRKISFISGKSFFDKTGKTQGTTQLFYAEHRSLPLAIIVFRGTEKGETLDAAADLFVNFSKIPSHPGNMMSGFMAAYGEIDSQLMTLLRQRETKNPGLKIMVVGHSLGGALSTVFSARFLDLQIKGSYKKLKLAGVYTLGSPRVGDDVFAARYDAFFYNQEIPVFRIRNHKDLVSGIPTGLPGTSGYWHVGSLVYYDANGRIHHGDSVNGWREIESKSDIGQSFPNNLKDHSVATYVENARKALQESTKAKNQSCKTNCGDKISMPYFEKASFRDKSIEDLAKEYGAMSSPTIGLDL